MKPPPGDEGCFGDAVIKTPRPEPGGVGHELGGLQGGSGLVGMDEPKVALPFHRLHQFVGQVECTADTNQTAEVNPALEGRAGVLPSPCALGLDAHQIRCLRIQDVGNLVEVALPQVLLVVPRAGERRERHADRQPDAAIDQEDDAPGPADGIARIDAANIHVISCKYSESLDDSSKASGLAL